MRRLKTQLDFPIVPLSSPFEIQSLKINGNTWYELNVISLKENPASAGGYSTSTKYKYVSIVYKGTFYDIRYVNLDEDGSCSESFDNFINTLAFKKE